MVFRYFKAGLFLIFTFSLFGCMSLSFSRLTEPHTAQTLGKGNNQIEVSGGDVIQTQQGEDLSSGKIFLSIGYTRGLSDNFDLAVFAEQKIESSLELLGSYLVGLEGKYQRIRNEPHTLSILMGAGLNKGKNPINKDIDAKEYENYKSLAKDSLLGFFSYIGAIYSFKPNEKYELALNIRTNHSYSESIYSHPTAKEIGRLTKLILSFGLMGGEKSEGASKKLSKVSNHFLYGSSNISNTWWMSPSFGATVSLGLLYSFLILDKDEFKFINLDVDPIPKLGFNFHYKF